MCTCVCVRASCQTVPDSIAFGCSLSVAEERKVSDNIQGLVIFHLFVVNQWNIREATLHLWADWSQSVPLKVCGLKFKKSLKGASYFSSCLTVCSHKAIATKISALKRVRLSFIEILQRRSVTSKRQIRLDQTVLHRFFFLLSISFHEADCHTSAVTHAGELGVLAGVV